MEAGETIPDLPQDVAAMKIEQDEYVANFQRIAGLTGDERQAALLAGWQNSRRPQELAGGRSATRPSPYSY